MSGILGGPRSREKRRMSSSLSTSYLKERSRRSRRLRKPTWSHELIMAAKALRRQYPRWGKEKLSILLAAEGWIGSVSTVGRILKYLKTGGDIVEPRRRAISAKRRMQRPCAVRKPKELPRYSPETSCRYITLIYVRSRGFTEAVYRPRCQTRSRTCAPTAL